MRTSNNVKDINIKNRTYYFFNDIIFTEHFDPNNIEIYEKSYKNILIYYNEYVTIKKDIKIYSVNPLYLIFGKVNGYFEEINENRYLTLFPTSESKEKIKKYKELWIKIKDLITSITKTSDDYDEKYIKIKFNLDDNLPLDKIKIKSENELKEIGVRNCVCYYFDDIIKGKKDDFSNIL